MKKSDFTTLGASAHSNEEREDKFRLLKDFGDYKKGKTFDSFGGLVMGICDEKTNQKINFDNKDYFKLV